MPGGDPVSVILTTHFRNEGLRRAIDHVLDQTYSPIEIIVVDDSGERYAEPVIKESDGVNYIFHNENQGQIAAWETGMEAAEGEYIQLHDDDDLLKAAKIEKQVHLFNSKDDVGVVFCGVEHPNWLVMPNGSMRDDALETVLRKRDYPCQTTTMLIRKKLLDDIFPLKKYPGSTDTALAIELASRTQFDFVNEALVHRKPPDEDPMTPRQPRALIQMVADYAHLYNRYPEGVRKDVLATANFQLGQALLVEYTWSVSAIAALLKANYYTDGIDLTYVKLLIGSIFGSPGLGIARQIGR